MGWNRGHDNRIMSEINITPLTDVMLVLLVIFMVTTPLLMTDSFKVRLPKAIAATNEPGKGAVVGVSASGDVSVNGRAVPIDGLYREIKGVLDGSLEKTVVVKADGSAKHSAVVKVLDTAKLAGAEKLSIATERERN